MKNNDLSVSTSVFLTILAFAIIVSPFALAAFFWCAYTIWHGLFAFFISMMVSRMLCDAVLVYLERLMLEQEIEILQSNIDSLLNQIKEMEKCSAR